MMGAMTSMWKTVWDRIQLINTRLSIQYNHSRTNTFPIWKFFSCRKTKIPNKYNYFVPFSSFLTTARLDPRRRRPVLDLSASSSSNSPSSVQLCCDALENDRRCLFLRESARLELNDCASSSSCMVRLDRLCRRRYWFVPLLAEAFAAHGNDLRQAAIKRSCAASRDRNDAKKWPLVLVVVTILMALGITNAVILFSIAVTSEKAITNWEVENEKKRKIRW